MKFKILFLTLAFGITAGMFAAEQETKKAHNIDMMALVHASINEAQKNGVGVRGGLVGPLNEQASHEEDQKFNRALDEANHLMHKCAKSFRTNKRLSTVSEELPDSETEDSQVLKETLPLTKSVGAKEKRQERFDSLVDAVRKNDADTLKQLIKQMESEVNPRFKFNELDRSISSDSKLKDETVDDTPLIIAARLGHVDIVKILIAHDADLEVPNDDGKIALDVAKNDEVRKLLKAAFERRSQT